MKYEKKETNVEESKENTRKYFIDNLRWMAILLLFPFHDAQIWAGANTADFTYGPIQSCCPICSQLPCIHGI